MMNTTKLQNSSIPLPKDELRKAKRESTFKTILAVIISNIFVYILVTPATNRPTPKVAEIKVRDGFSKIKLPVSKIYTSSPKKRNQAVTIIVGTKTIVRKAFYHKALKDSEHLLEVPTKKLLELLNQSGEKLSIIPYMEAPIRYGTKKRIKQYEIVF